MKNSKIIIIAASLVLAAALALCGCVYLIGQPDDETKQYDPDGMSLPSVIEEAPSAQSEMQKKFGAYGREETGENGERIFRLFTEEQIEESLTLRKNGERRMLTYEEILFLINDSIRMYFEYDKIILTDYICHTHDKTPTSPIDFEMMLNNNRYRRCEVYTYDYIELTPYHGDYSDKSSYAEALATYRGMIEDIRTMILERLRIHDTGSDSYCLLSPLNDSDYTHLYGILLDGGKITDAEEYETLLNNTIKDSMTGSELVAAEDKYPLVRMVEQYDEDSGKPQLSIYYIATGEESREKLYPTEQLDALRPDGKLTLTGYTNESMPREITIEFDRWTGRVVYTDYNEPYIARTGFYHSEIIGAVGNAVLLSFDGKDSKCLRFEGNTVKIYSGISALMRDDEKWDEEITVEIQSPYSGETDLSDIFFKELK